MLINISEKETKELMEIVYKNWGIIIFVLPIVWHLISQYFKLQGVKKMIDDSHITLRGDMGSLEQRVQIKFLEHDKAINEKMARMEEEMRSNISNISGDVRDMKADMRILLEFVKDDKEFKKTQSESITNFYREYGGILNNLKNNKS